MTKKVLHVKPTAEELEAKAQEALIEADKLKANPPEPEEEPVVEPVADLIPDVEPEPELDIDDVPEPEEETPEPEEEAPEPEPSPDYKEKFKQSTAEAQVLSAKERKMNDAFDRASSVAEPTEEEMKAEFPDWDMMSDFEKQMATKATLSDRRFTAIAEVSKEFKDIEAWQVKVETFLDDPKLAKQHPDLVGKEEEFKLFSLKPTRRGVDFEDLVSSFLWANKEARPNNKGKMFEQGTGGPPSKTERRSDKITVEQARTLRNTDYKKYKELLTAGKIDNENI